ncbi:MAG: hypothetical protein ABIG03_05655 [Candidatus Eisenbacteria bacterium]
MTRIANLFSRLPYARVIRCGVSAQIAGVLMLSVLLFTKIPLIITICLPLGALLVLLGAVAWVWGAVWGLE